MLFRFIVRTGFDLSLRFASLSTVKLLFRFGYTISNSICLETPPRARLECSYSGLEMLNSRQ